MHRIDSFLHRQLFGYLRNVGLDSERVQSEHGYLGCVQMVEAQLGTNAEQPLRS